jgi:polyhydroxyalkanoate synthesis regulator phasin
MKLRRNFLPDITRYEEVSNELHRFKAECESRIRNLIEQLRANKKRFEDSESRVAAVERQKILDYSLPNQTQTPSRQLRKKSSRILSNLMVSQDRFRQSVKFEADSELQEVGRADRRRQTASR